MRILESAQTKIKSQAQSKALLDTVALREAVFMILERADRKLDLIDLACVIGLADHILIKKVGTSLSGDDYILSPVGPIPIHLLMQLLSAEAAGELWQGRIAVQDAQLTLQGAGTSKHLSRGQIAALTEAFDSLMTQRHGLAAEVLAEYVPLWIEKLGQIVTLSDCLQALGASKEDSESQVAEIRANYRTEDSAWEA